MAERKLLGANLPTDEQIVLAQLTLHPGWRVLVKVMAEACREATEAVIKLDPSVDRYGEKLQAFQTTARAMNKFSSDLLASINVHQTRAVQHVEKETTGEPERNTRFKGFKPPTAPKQSPPEGEVVQSNNEVSK